MHVFEKFGSLNPTRTYDPRVNNSTLRAPAMAAGVTHRLWEASDVVALLEAEETGVGKSGMIKTLARYIVEG